MGVATEDPQFIDNDGLSDDDIPEEAHKSLLKAVSQLYKKQRIEAPKRKEAAQVISEFNLSKNAEGGSSKVHVNELLKDLKQKVTHKEINKKVLDAQKKSKTLPSPLEKNEAEKIYRKVGYENVKKKLNKWETIVERNRLASQLTFPLLQKEPQKEPVNFLKTFQKPTELEQAMAALLNQSETAQEERKVEDDLSRLSIEEMIDRRRMMAKMKARESYRIAKAVRQNKIKSKKYRRILKKEKIKQELVNFEKLQKTDPEAALEKLEQIERARAEERISLRHRNTGKWAKSQAIRAKYDTEARIQLAEQLAKSRDLTRKIRNNESSDEEGETEEDRSDDEMNIELPQAGISDSTQKSNNPWFNNEFENFLKGCNEFLNNTSGNQQSKEPVSEITTEGLPQAVSNSHETDNKNETNQIDGGSTQSPSIINNINPVNDSESIAKLNYEENMKEVKPESSPEKEKSPPKENNFKEKQQNEMVSSEFHTNENLSEKQVNVRKSVSTESLVTCRIGNIPDVTKNMTTTPQKSLILNIPLTEESSKQNISPKINTSNSVTKSDNDVSEEVNSASIPNNEDSSAVNTVSIEIDNSSEEVSIASNQADVDSSEEVNIASIQSDDSSEEVHMSSIQANEDSSSSIQIDEDKSEEENVLLSEPQNKSPPSIAKKRKKTLITNSGAWDVVDDHPAKRKKIVDDRATQKKKKIDGGPVKNKKKKESISEPNKKQIKIQKKKKLKEKSIADLFDNAQDAIANHTLKAALKIKSDLENNKISNMNIVHEDDESKKNQINKPRGIDAALVELHEEGISSGANDLKVLKDKLSGIEHGSKKEPEIDPNKHINVKPQKLFSEIGDIEEKEDDDSDDNEDSQRLHLMEAFADDDIADEFRKEKDKEAEKNKAKDINLLMPGWGSWGGTSIKPRTKRKHRRFMVRIPKVPRKDENKQAVIINEDPIPKLKAHLVNELPYPFTSVKEFEATIRAPIGKHWIPEKAHKKLTAPPVRTRMGTIITPMSDDNIVSKPKRKKRINKD